jgi:UDP-N-acetylmuramoyl-tripeptide--D-alanyl-D-alanine ligase
MITLSEDEAGRALGLGPLAAPVTGVSIDSRSTLPGDLFVALRGERFDGHDFVDAAFAAGASGAVVERQTWLSRCTAQGARQGAMGSARHPVYQVGDTLEALGVLAREVRRRSRATIFAITGSVGKTSTKDVLRAMVGRVREVAATAANQNNEVGVPLTLLAMEPGTEAVIVEMGMRGRGQIAALARIAEPDIGVITNVHPVHLEILGTLEEVAEAKAELVAGLKPGGTAVVPGDCVLLRPHVTAAGRRVVSFGSGAEARDADVQGTLEAREGGAGCVLVLRWPAGRVELECAYLPRHRLENAVAAAAACYAAGLPVEECAAGLADVRPSGGRGDVVSLPGLCVIDDTYNANPAAVRAALDDLVRLVSERGGRAVAILGDMLELGTQSERFHEEAGDYAAAIGVRALWGVGPLARATVAGFERHWREGPDPASEWTAGHVGSAEETSTVAAGLRPGDVVLFKASRSMRLEKMVGRVVEAAEAGTWSPTSVPPAGKVDRREEPGTCSD